MKFFSSGVKRLLVSSSVVFLMLCTPVSRAQYGPPVGKEVQYKIVDGKPLHLYISSPPESLKGPHAAIVFIHGGGGTGGTVSQFNRQSTALAALGMVAIEVQYRLLAPPPSMDNPRICVEDAKSAMRWVRLHAQELQINPDRIVVSGGSAGGYLAAATALVPAWDDPGDDLKVSPKPNALILFFPAMDISPEQGHGASRFGPDWAKYAPETYLSAKTPPTIIFAGLSDKLVTPDALRNYKALADKAGNRCELNFYAGQPHGFANKEPYLTETLKQAIVFLKSLGYLPPPDGTSPVTK